MQTKTDHNLEKGKNKFGKGPDKFWNKFETCPERVHTTGHSLDQVRSKFGTSPDKSGNSLEQVRNKCGQRVEQMLKRRRKGLEKR